MSLSALPGPVGQRQLQRLALVDHALARQRHPHDLHVLARPLQLAGEALAVPALGHLRAARPDPEQHPAVGELIDRRGGHRGHRGRAAGHLEDRRAELDPRRRLREPGEDRRRVGAVGLGGPDRVVAEPLRLQHQLQLLRCGEPEAPVSDVQPELHCKRPPSRCRAPSAAYGRRRARPYHRARERHPVSPAPRGPRCSRESERTRSSAAPTRTAAAGSARCSPLTATAAA